MTVQSILKTYAWFIFSYGQWMLFRTKKEFREYKRNNSTIYTIKQLRPIAEIEETFKCEPFVESKTWDIHDGMAIPLDIDMIDCDSDLEALENELTPLQQWFLDRASEFEFHPILAYCHICDNEANYNGITQALNYDDERVINGTIFQFCKSCRDKLVQHAICQKSHPERIGA